MCWEGLSGETMSASLLAIRYRLLYSIEGHGGPLSGAPTERRMLLGHQLRVWDKYIYWFCRTGALSPASWLQVWQQVRKFDRFFVLDWCPETSLGQDIRPEAGAAGLRFSQIKGMF